MDFILAGFIEAIRLLLGGDGQTWSAVAATLQASTGSMVASLILGIPLGFVLGYFDFPARRQVRLIVDTALALPTVFIGLVGFSLSGWNARSDGGEHLVGPTEVPPDDIEVDESELFRHKNFRLVESVDESIAINRIKSGAIIISAVAVDRLKHRATRDAA